MPLPQGFVATSLAVAPSDADRIYAAGLHDDGAAWRGEMARSVDGGASWTLHDLPGTDYDNLPFIADVHGSLPDRLYLSVAATPGRLLLTDDGGESWSEIFEASGPITSFALAPDGAAMLAGNPTDGLWRADTATHTFEPLSTSGPECLRWSESGLYGCFSQYNDGFFVGLSTDGGETFDPLLELPCWPCRA